MYRRRSFLLAILAATLYAHPPAYGADADKEPLVVFAASSLTDAMEKIGPVYTQQTGQPVQFSYAASSVLARQIEAGPKADVFFSADTSWMDYLQERDLIDKSTRRDLLGNRLVLVAPASSKIELKIAPDFPLAAALGKGRLATGDPDSVPVGRYARSALTSLGVWNSVADRLIRAENVRSALAFIARGEAPLGIVHDTDARVEKQVRVVDTFPEDTHLPIVYPVAATAHAKPAAAAFVEYLSGPAAAETFEQYGFEVLR